MAAGINDRGVLLVRLSSGDIETVSAGDVTLLKDKKVNIKKQK
jgi:biotin-(acetyl-CoA carboxylase) ligase